MIIAGKSGVQAQFLAYTYMGYICLQRQCIKYKHNWLFKRYILQLLKVYWPSKLNTLHVKKMLLRSNSLRSNERKLFTSYILQIFTHKHRITRVILNTPPLYNFLFNFFLNFIFTYFIYCNKHNSKRAIITQLTIRITYTVSKIHDSQ